MCRTRQSTLIHSDQTFQISDEPLVSQCELFNDPALLAAPYTVRSSVPLAIFREFLAALNEETFELTYENVGGLSLLCDEFGFRAFSARLEAEVLQLRGGPKASAEVSLPIVLFLQNGFSE
jgi:hypothetical protein